MNQKQIDSAVIYIRVSTNQHDEDALDLANQEQLCRNYCKQKGLAVVESLTAPTRSH